MNTKKILSALSAAFLSLVAFAGQVGAQSSWSQCTDGRAIVRCETYDCPEGDTNRDGRCTLTDDDARLTDARNDPFCANPISGCGQVHYYPAGSASSCLERVEEAGLNCDLYAVATPSFTPSPTTTARATVTPTPSPRASATPTASPVGGDRQLPKTGPENTWIIFGILIAGGIGIFLYERHKVV